MVFQHGSVGFRTAKGMMMPADSVISLLAFPEDLITAQIRIRFLIIQLSRMRKAAPRGHEQMMRRNETVLQPVAEVHLMGYDAAFSGRDKRRAAAVQTAFFQIIIRVRNGDDFMKLAEQR